MEALRRSRKELHRMQLAATLDVLCSNQVAPLGYARMSQPLPRWFVLNKKKKGANAALAVAAAVELVQSEAVQWCDHVLEIFRLSFNLSKLCSPGPGFREPQSCTRGLQGSMRGIIHNVPPDPGYGPAPPTHRFDEGVGAVPARTRRGRTAGRSPQDRTSSRTFD